MDIPIMILITGEELSGLQRQTWQMAEAFNLGMFGNQKEVVVCSLTHLSLNLRHPLAKEIHDYQRERNKKLAQQDYVEHF
jgi:hypothetical protein